MDLVRTWDWRAWTVLALLAGLLLWWLWRAVRALAFRHLLLDGLARRNGWRVQHGDVAAGRREFRRQQASRARAGRRLLRRGVAGIREGYRTGVFRRAHSSSPIMELSLTGRYRGWAFTATQWRRYRFSGGAEPSRSVSHRAVLEVPVATAPPAVISVRRLSGRIQLDGAIRELPPGLVRLLKRNRLRLGTIRSTPGQLSADVRGRLYRASLLGGLAVLTSLAEYTRTSPK